MGTLRVGSMSLMTMMTALSVGGLAVLILLLISTLQKNRAEKGR